MSSSKVSIAAFGVYVMLIGLTLILAPNLLLSVFGFPPTQEIWIRVLGALALVLGYYYWACAKANVVDFYRATIIGRPLFALLCVGLVAFAGSPWQLILFGLADVAGAMWTAAALRSEAAQRA